MKVKEISGFWDARNPNALGDLKYIAYYYAKIEDRYVILERRLQNEFTSRGPTVKYKLCDRITWIFTCNDEKELEETIQEIIQHKDEGDASIFFEDQLCFPPLEMQNGREIDLNLANIEVPRNSSNDQASYEYVIDKKREELLLDRLEELQQTIKNSPERYSIESYIEKYEQQSGTQLSKQQISRLKELDDKIQKGLIFGKYNLEDYRNFVNSIPDLLSGKRVLGVGRFGSDGKFGANGEISKLPSVKEMALYSTYPYRIRRQQKFTMDDFQVMPSPSIKTRIAQDGLYPTETLCALDIRQSNLARGEIYDYNNGILIVEPLDIRKAHLFACVSEWTAAGISAYLEESSREGLVTDAQAQLIELADKKPNERSEEQL